MKTAFLDCFSGLSGDMFLGSLLDAGLSFDTLKQCLQTLPFHGYKLEFKREMRQQISGTRFLVHLDKNPHGKHGHKKAEQTKSAHENRGLEAIGEIIGRGELTDSVKAKSMAIFESLAQVEGHIHSLPPEEVHFHEVGAVDSIIDIVGTVFALETLGIERLVVSPLSLGSGFINTAHGRIPVPAPATLALLKGIPVTNSGVRQEMVTPTGAALATGLADSFGAMPPMVVQTVGYGVGSRELPDRPNLLRIIIGHETEENQTDTVIVLETNLDDMRPEGLGYLMERLFQAGALDVVFFPAQMKKNRPGVQVQVVARPDQKDRLVKIMVQETTTLGIRFRYSQRIVLNRSNEEIESPWGRIGVKRVIQNEVARLVPEYDVCREIALKHNIPLREIYQWIESLNITH
ncbi:MAG: nickel pincer cofactor biosynthesis protein LarC [Deltaproteobacteria bacterium]|nr:nickel pincer cofactor biosynthesis protein LarC [Deltaproteobacteria bacterium]